MCPRSILVLLPFAFLFGVLGAFVDLNRKSELIAMRAAGVSAWRFILPAAGAAFAIGIVTVGGVQPAGLDHERPVRAGAQRADGRRAVQRAEGYLAAPGRRQTQIVIRARAGDDDHGMLRLRGVSLFISTLTSQGAAQFSRRVEAAQALADARPLAA